MLRSYLKIALRNLLKSKVSSFINITGLAVGMAVAMLIGLAMSSPLPPRQPVRAAAFRRYLIW